jgi:hypothetical protein
VSNATAAGVFTAVVVIVAAVLISEATSADGIERNKSGGPGVSLKD